VEDKTIAASFEFRKIHPSYYELSRNNIRTDPAFLQKCH
jgi:hypothetical protein